jgi:hypothetical protein
MEMKRVAMTVAQCISALAVLALVALVSYLLCSLGYKSGYFWEYMMNSSIRNSRHLPTV